MLVPNVMAIHPIVVISRKTKIVNLLEALEENSGDQVKLLEYVISEPQMSVQLHLQLHLVAFHPVDVRAFNRE